MDDTSLQAIGKAGQFVTAVLQTAGMYSQNEILRTFTPFFSSFGALIYLVALLSAVVSVALFGNYRSAIYLLVGPGLFSWMLFTTVESNGTAFEFGNRADSNSTRQQEVLSSSSSGYDTDKPARVSWFYANFDRTVSYVVQKIVSVLIATDLKTDLVSIARERMFARVLQGRSVDPQFLALFTLTLQGDCHQFIQASRTLSEKLYLSPVAGGELDAQKKLYEEQQRLGGEQVIAISSDSLLGYLRANLDTSKFTIPDSGNMNATCKQVWDMTVELLEKESSSALTPTVHEREQFDITWETVIGSVEKKLCSEVQNDKCKTMDTAQLTEIAKRIVMAQIVKNTLATTPHSMFMTQVAGHGKWENGDDHRRLMGDIVSHEQNSYRFLISYLAATIPYLQGLLLYMLSAMFPFFTIFLLLPGRYSSFMVWPFLWLWVKSWDVGYAIVFLFREVLWDLFPYVGQARGTANYDTLTWDDTNPSHLLNLVYAGDPSSNATLYWTIVGCLTLSVPCLTAYLCLGASNLFSAFKMAFEDVPMEMQGDRRNMSEAMVSSAWDKDINRESARAWYKGASEARENSGDVDGISRESMGDSTRANHITVSGNMARTQSWFNGDIQGTLHARNALMCRAFGLPNPNNYQDMQTLTMNSVQEHAMADNWYARDFSSRPLNVSGPGGDTSQLQGAGAGVPAAPSSAPSTAD